MMKLCGRIDTDQALMQYRQRIREAERVALAKARPKNKAMVEQKRTIRCWRRRLADALR